MIEAQTSLGDRPDRGVILFRHFPHRGNLVVRGEQSDRSAWHRLPKKTDVEIFAACKQDVTDLVKSTITDAGGRILTDNPEVGVNGVVRKSVVHSLARLPRVKHVRVYGPAVRI